MLEAALAHDPETQEKIGAGLKSFSARSADFGSKYFWVNRTDGTTRKRSLTACAWNTQARLEYGYTAHLFIASAFG
ncbi:DUF3223 domain-containing protein [Chelativorans salis]|uniref:DUF3223 domain-containing protein n=1 Tax=Chelativorans salis TaxID=2978478 RepID=UPI003133C807